MHFVINAIEQNLAASTSNKCGEILIHAFIISRPDICDYLFYCYIDFKVSKKCSCCFVIFLVITQILVGQVL